jgi:hypothetical protein
MGDRSGRSVGNATPLFPVLNRIDGKPVPLRELPLAELQLYPDFSDVIGRRYVNLNTWNILALRKIHSLTDRMEKPLINGPSSFCFGRQLPSVFAFTNRSNCRTIAHALKRAAFTIVSTLLRVRSPCVDAIIDAARKEAQFYLALCARTL